MGMGRLVISHLNKIYNLTKLLINRLKKIFKNI